MTLVTTDRALNSEDAKFMKRFHVSFRYDRTLSVDQFGSVVKRCVTLDDLHRPHQTWLRWRIPGTRLVKFVKGVVLPSYKSTPEILVLKNTYASYCTNGNYQGIVMFNERVATFCIPADHKRVIHGQLTAFNPVVAVSWLWWVSMFRGAQAVQAL